MSCDASDPDSINRVPMISNDLRKAIERQLEEIEDGQGCGCCGDNRQMDQAIAKIRELIAPNETLPSER